MRFCDWNLIEFKRTWCLSKPRTGLQVNSPDLFKPDQYITHIVWQVLKNKFSGYSNMYFVFLISWLQHPLSDVALLNAAVNGHLELALLKDRRRFNAISTSNLEVYEFRDWWILTCFIFGHGESSPNNIWSMVNLGRTCVLLFYYFLCLKVNLDLAKNKSAWWIFTQLYFRGGESWPNYFGKEVNWWWILT